MAAGLVQPTILCTTSEPLSQPFRLPVLEPVSVRSIPMSLAAWLEEWLRDPDDARAVFWLCCSCRCPTAWLRHRDPNHSAVAPSRVGAVLLTGIGSLGGSLKPRSYIEDG